MEGPLLIAMHLQLVLHLHHVLHQFVKLELTLIMEYLFRARTFPIKMQEHQI